MRGPSLRRPGDVARSSCHRERGQPYSVVDGIQGTLGGEAFLSSAADCALRISNSLVTELVLARLNEGPVRRVRRVVDRVTTQVDDIVLPVCLRPGGGGHSAGSSKLAGRAPAAAADPRMAAVVYRGNRRGGERGPVTRPSARRGSRPRPRGAACSPGRLR